MSSLVEARLWHTQPGFVALADDHSRRGIGVKLPLNGIDTEIRIQNRPARQVQGNPTNVAIRL